MTLKETVYHQFRILLQDKINRLQSTIYDLRQSAANETKSTAGDKHETALAMLQIEQANSGRQMTELLQQKEQFDKINPKTTSQKVAIGSFIKTNNGCLFLSVSLGKTIINGLSVMAISPQSPLGSKLLGLGKNDVVHVNGRDFRIEQVE